jgi:hypothetical protein
MKETFLHFDPYVFYYSQFSHETSFMSCFNPLNLRYKSDKEKESINEKKIHQ